MLGDLLIGSIDPVVALGAAGGAITAIWGAVKVVTMMGVEKVDVKITTADKVMIGQDRFIESLEQSVKDANERITVLAESVEALRTELRVVTDERDQLRAERERLRGRVEHLEQRVADLSTGREKESRAERRDREDLDH